MIFITPAEATAFVVACESPVNLSNEASVRVSGFVGPRGRGRTEVFPEKEKAPRYVTAGPVVEMFMKTAASIDRHRGKIETARHGACESFGAW